MRPLFIFSLLLLSLAGFAQNKEPYSWYKCLTGKIDKYPVTMHLYKAGKDYSGYYYYNSSEQPLSFSGTLEKMLKLTIYKDDQEEILEGIFTDTSFSGTWSFNKKLLPFRLTVKKDVDPRFDYVVVKGTKKLPKSDDNFGREELSFSAAAVWPVVTKRTNASDSLKKMIAQYSTKDYQEDIGKAFLRNKNAFLNKTGNKKEDEIDEFEVDNKIKIVFSNSAIISLSHFNYTDHGGAHGLYGTSYSCLQLANGKSISITDIFDTTVVAKQLIVLLEKKIRKQYKLSDKEPLGSQLLVEEIFLTDNLLITSKCIGFNYVPYEIGPYAYGDMLILLTYAELEPLMRPSFKALMKQ